MSDVEHANGVDSLENVTVDREKFKKLIEDMEKAPREEPADKNQG
jgi:hypothetical protein